LIISLSALVFVIHSFAPDRTGNIVLFYALAGLLIFSMTSIAGFYLRRLFGQPEFSGSYAAGASRQGLWLSLILIISLILLRHNLFTWINGGLLTLTFIFFESYLLTRSSKEKNTE
jgi:hypothetical protein